MMALPILAKKVKQIASVQLFNIKLLINGRGLSKFKKEYQLGEEMGQGGFGVVYRAIRLADGLPVAVKFIERQHVREWGKFNDERLPMEICMLARCAKVSGVVRLLDWFSIPEGFFIIMERPSSCVDLFDFIHNHGCLSEDLARFFFRQIVKTTMKCMKRKVLHRDIKDENVVINLHNGEIRLVDFGAATILKKTRYQDFQGTRLYCPPEWFLHTIYLGTEATVWSLGVLLYNMLNGKLPFHNEKDICTAHLLGPLPFFSKLSTGARSLIEKCLRFDPYRRPSLDTIMEDPWLNQPIDDWAHLSSFSCKKERMIKIIVNALPPKLPKNMPKSTMAIANCDQKFITASNIDFEATVDVNNNNDNNSFHHNNNQNRLKDEVVERVEFGVASDPSRELTISNHTFYDALLTEDEQSGKVGMDVRRLTKSIGRQISSLTWLSPFQRPNATPGLLRLQTPNQNKLGIAMIVSMQNALKFLC